MPVKRIVAEAEVSEVSMLPPEALWKITKDESVIDKKFFDEYFVGRKIAYAYKLGKVKIFETPKYLADY